MMRLLADMSTGRPVNPLAEGLGWWRRDVRLQFQPVSNVAGLSPRGRFEPAPAATSPILIAGATGALGQALARACHRRGLSYVLAGRRRMPLEDSAAITRTVERHRPWAVVNAAGWTQLDEAEGDPGGCRLANLTGAMNLAEAAFAIDAHYTAFSTDQVFGGQLERPYVESDAPRPLNIYGASKLAAERGLLALDGQALVVRTAALFSPDDSCGFAAQVARRLSAGRSIQAASDVVVSPTYLPHLCDAVLDLVIDGEAGLWHLTNGEAMSWAAFGEAIADALDLDSRLVRATSHKDMGWRARRPANAALATERGVRMPHLSTGIAQYAAAVREGQVLSPPAVERVDGRVGWVA